MTPNKGGNFNDCCASIVDTHKEGESGKFVNLFNDKPFSRHPQLPSGGVSSTMGIMARGKWNKWVCLPRTIVWI